MIEGDSNALDPTFLEDFYSESDDHLTQIRSQLSSLIATTGVSLEQAQGAWEVILRNLHSLKGIIAIVGLRDAEQLAHTAEDCVRPWARRKSAAPPEALSLLDATAQRLEQVISNHRQGHPLPSSDDLQQKLLVLKGENDAQTSAPPLTSTDTTMSPLKEQPTSWRIVYRPTAEGDARGLNLGSVKARLLQLGKLLRTTPSVEKGGGLRFEFILAASELSPEQFSLWKNDGLEFSPVEPTDTSGGNMGQYSNAEATAADEGTSNLHITPSHLVRVDLGRLDELMRITGELVIQRSKLDDALEQTDFSTKNRFQEINTRLGKSLRDLREALTRVRMVPIAEIFTRLPFVVRDLSAAMKKRVHLQIEGQQTEIDKHLVERLKEPLLHLIRNALSHGIELPAERERAGKPAEASLVIRATQAGPNIVIEFSDDGRGVDRERVIARAHSLGIPINEPVDDQHLLDLLCVSGLSTRAEADLVSGKGVGMAVVRDSIRGIGGALRLTTRSGQGTQFSLFMPVMLSITEAIILSVGQQQYAVPRSYVREIIQHPSDGLRQVNGTMLLPYRGDLIPLISLRKYFRQPPLPQRELTALIIITEKGLAAIHVDRVHGQREIVVRSLRDPLVRVKGIGGATELGDGKPLLILDVAELTSGYAGSSHPERPHPPNRTFLSA
ncbi:MAG TPA: chemotaxis protein CheA [Opitutaceae bacterium]|nr:chemotaxis protein CheA [Opitutaceae bacterium]